MKYWIHRLPVLVTVLAALSAQADESARILYSEPLSGLHVTRAGTGTAKPESTERLGFDAFGRRFQLELEPNRRLLDALGRQSLPPGIEVYRGALAGAPGSWARIVVDNGRPAGLLHDGKELFAIERPAGGDEPVMFRLADLHVEPGTLNCASEATTAGAMLASLDTEFAPAAAAGAVVEIDLGLLGDFEFASGNITGAESAIVTRMNVVDGIFSEQLGVQLNLNRIDVFDNPNDPFSDETDAGALLDELANYRLATPAQQDNGLTHLFTGRDLDGTTVGIAFTGALCHPRAGAGLTQASVSATVDSLVAAHELGHNFGAPHDGEAGSACEATSENFLMAPRINGSDQFSACSIDQVQDDVDRATCITPLPATDVAVIAGPSPGTVLLGDTATIAFDVDSRGTQTADDVTLAISVPGGFDLQSATASAGSCTTGAGSVDCALGSISGGSGATVSVTVVASDVGTFEFAATVGAAADANANNNEAMQSVTVEPAVDLSVTVPFATQVETNQAVTLSPAIANPGEVAASDLVVTIVPDNGLRIDTATLTGGSCTVDTDQASCTVASLGADSGATLELVITGIVAGAHSYSVDVRSGTAERNSADNAATGQVTVGRSPANEPGSDSGDSGGGSSGPGLLLLVLAMLAGRRRGRCKFTAK